MYARELFGLSEARYQFILYMGESCYTEPGGYIRNLDCAQAWGLEAGIHHLRLGCLLAA